MQRSDFRFFERLRVRWAEIDAQQIVFNSHYLTYFDTAVAGYWRALAMPYAATMQSLGGDILLVAKTLEADARGAQGAEQGQFAKLVRARKDPFHLGAERLRAVPRVFAQHAVEGGLVELALAVGLFRLSLRPVEVAHHLGDGDQVARVDLGLVLLSAPAPHGALHARPSLEGLDRLLDGRLLGQLAHADARRLASRNPQRHLVLLEVDDDSSSFAPAISCSSILTIRPTP